MKGRIEVISKGIEKKQVLMMPCCAGTKANLAK